MAHEAMQRTLSAQANAIWPQETRLFDRYDLPEAARIADVGCGTGEITTRLAERYPGATLVGVDILESSVAVARQRAASFGDRVSFDQGDAFALEFETGSLDLVVCRHLTQSVPHPERVLAELVRVTRPGGWVHVLSEDYGMLHFPERHGIDPDRLWHQGTRLFSRATNVDERIGRKTGPLLRALGLGELSVDHAIVDTERVPRATFAEIIRSWADGYVDVIAGATGWPREEVNGYFEASIEAIVDESSYASWHVPIVSGRKPR